MRAIRVHEFGGPEVLRWEDGDDLSPGPEEVLVHLLATGVNPVDTYIRSGIYGTRPLPYTPGTDGAGMVAAVGSQVTSPKVGDRVYVTGSLTGTYAEQCLCRPAQCHPLPEHLSFAQGATLYVPYTTAYKALFLRGQARPGETVLIQGASGGVGLAAVQLARAAGLKVLGTGGTADGRALVLREGAEAVLDHHQADFVEQVMEWSAGQGVNLILEMLANVNLQKDLTMLARFGRVVVIGSRGTIEINPRDTMSRDADIRGMSLFNSPDEELIRIQWALRAGLENRSVRPVVAKEFPLEQAGWAHEAVMAPGAQGKIVLVSPREEEPS